MRVLCYDDDDDGMLLFLLISQEQQGGRCSMMPLEVKGQIEFNRDAGWLGMGYELPQ
jgi:hypothetical protein